MAVPAATSQLRLETDAADMPRIHTGIAGVDRVLGGGLVPASVSLLAGEPGIGKSTLLLQVIANLTAQGHQCLLVSGEESRSQVASRARRLGIDSSRIRFGPGRDLASVVEAGRAEHPFLLAVDSIQTIRDSGGSQIPGGTAQVRACADALLGLAKSEGIAVLATGHVTKEGDLAGPRTLEHVVDVVLCFEGDPGSGLRALAGGKNRFGPEGETAWFEMGPGGLGEIDPTRLFVSDDPHAGAATGLPRAGRRALGVEIQALVGNPEGPARRQTTGIDPRRFSLVAAVLATTIGLGIGRAELYGASSAGVRVDDPACDLAIAAALASAATGIPPPRGAAFFGEVALTGQIRPTPAVESRLAAARAAGCRTVFGPGDPGRGDLVPEGSRPQDASKNNLRFVPVRSVAQALEWAHKPVESRRSKG